MRIHQLGRLSVLSILLASCFTTQAANAADTLLLRQPTVSATIWRLYMQVTSGWQIATANILCD